MRSDHLSIMWLCKEMVEVYPKYLRVEQFEGFRNQSYSQSIMPKIVASMVTLLLGVIFVSVPRFADTALGEILGVAVTFVGLIVLFVASVILSRPLTSLAGLSGMLIGLIGVLLIFNPAIGVTIVGGLMGLLLVLQGVVEVRFGSSGVSTNVARAMVAIGVLSIIGGTVFLLFPVLSLSALTMAVGIWVVAASVVRLSYGVWVHLRCQ